MMVVYPFGCPNNIESNKTLALITANKVKESKENKNITVFTQYDILLDETIEALTIRPDEIMNNPFTTYELSLKAVEWAIENKVTKISIIAAKPHIDRCYRDITYIAEQKKLEINFEKCKEVYSKHYKKSWFCEESKEWWTRSPWLWWPREMMLLLTPIYFYKKITVKNR